MSRSKKKVNKPRNIQKDINACLPTKAPGVWVLIELTPPYGQSNEEKESDIPVIIMDVDCEDAKTERLFQNTGRVLDIGPDAYGFTKNGPWCKVGDLVYFEKYAGPAWEYKGIALRIVKDIHIGPTLDFPENSEIGRELVERRLGVKSNGNTGSKRKS